MGGGSGVQKSGTRNWSERGSVIVIVAVSAVFVLGFFTLSLDAGRVYVLKEQLQTAADASALAGASLLPTSPSGAVTAAENTAVANGVPAADVTATVSGVAGNQLTVTIVEREPLVFGPLIGISSTQVSAVAGAAIGQLNTFTGLLPLGVEMTTWTTGQTYTLKIGNGSTSNGDLGPVWFGDGSPGATTYEQDLINGTQLPITVGEIISTQPGDMVGPTEQGLSARLAACSAAGEASAEGSGSTIVNSPCLLYLPIISLPSGGRTTVTVLGFAAFWLQSVHGGAVTGSFISAVVNGSIGPYVPSTTNLMGVTLDQ
ncbi:MAG: pilus assembly protein TadG-related protein [Sulfobacillus sp.]